MTIDEIYDDRKGFSINPNAIASVIGNVLIPFRIIGRFTHSFKGAMIHTRRGKISLENESPDGLLQCRDVSEEPGKTLGY